MPELGQAKLDPHLRLGGYEGGFLAGYTASFSGELNPYSRLGGAGPMTAPTAVSLDPHSRLGGYEGGWAQGYTAGLKGELDTAEPETAGRAGLKLDPHSRLGGYEGGYLMGYDSAVKGEAAPPGIELDPHSRLGGYAGGFAKGYQAGQKGLLSKEEGGGPAKVLMHNTFSGACQPHHATI